MISIWGLEIGSASFTVLQWHAARSFHEKSARPSVKCVNCDRTKETSAHLIISYEWSMRLVLRHKEWLVGDVPFYVKLWAKVTHPFKNGEFQSIFARSASAITPSEKSSIITNRNPLRAFQWSYDEQRTLPVSPHPAVRFLCDSWVTCCVSPCDSDIFCKNCDICCYWFVFIFFGV